MTIANPDGRWSVGIDLGTTHCAMVVKGPDDETFRIVDIPQFLDVGEVHDQPLLASFGLQPTDEQRSRLEGGLPWGYRAGLIVGEMARASALKMPDRVIVSAKSWLSHEGVDRTENILPWGAGADVTRCSPVIAASAYLSHLRRTFEFRFPEAGPLAEQNVVLTVPASFDPVARELTQQAAKIAGLGTPRLLEEPQAALYAWLGAKGDDWRDELIADDLVLVCDVGGGTTDFSLIKIVNSNGDLGLERIAVGDHILLGGDNMDLALAFALRHRLQQEQSIRLERWQVQALTQACRKAKESLLGDDSLDEAAVVIPSRGSGLVGGSIRTSLSRALIEQVLVDGFLPMVEWNQTEAQSVGSALSEVGLPYARDPAITRHLAAFLKRHLASDGMLNLPTTVLFNGGVFKAAKLQQRVCASLDEWRRVHGQAPIRRLEAGSLDTSVAHGAARFADLVNGGGIRIRGGVAHSYYIGVEEAMPAIPGFEPPVNAVCVVPAGTEEGSRLVLAQHRFTLRLEQASSFRLFSSSVRKDDGVGTTFEVWEEPTLVELPSVQAKLASGDDLQEVVVSIESVVTEVGTIQLYCVSSDDDGRRWGLEFDVRLHEGQG